MISPSIVLEHRELWSSNGKCFFVAVAFRFSSTNVCIAERKINL